MKSNYCLIVVCGLLLFLGNACGWRQNDELKSNDSSSAKKSNVRQILIDKFVVPDAAKAEFLERLRINLDLIKKQPGFVETAAYEKTGGEGEFNFVTVAVWESEEALARTKQAVSTEYQKQNFDLPAMLERLNIKIDRAVYKKLAD